MARGKGKGSAFERLICKQLSLWWTEGERDDVFWRTSTSGGRATVRRKTRKDTFGQAGDVQATDPIGQPLIDICAIEIKRGYGRASVADVLDAPANAARSPWLLWLDQVVGEAEEDGRPYWMLITKRDRRDALVFIPHSLYLKLRHAGADLHKVQPRVLIRIEELVVYGMVLDRFLESVSPENILFCQKQAV